MLSTGSVLYGRSMLAKERLADVPLHSIPAGLTSSGAFVWGARGADLRRRERWHRPGSGRARMDRRWFPERTRGRAGLREAISLAADGLLADPGPRAFTSLLRRAHRGVDHGDLIELSPRGSARIFGRCDGISTFADPHRSAEIYDVLPAPFRRSSRMASIKRRRKKPVGAPGVVRGSSPSHARSAADPPAEEGAQAARLERARSAVIVAVDELRPLSSGKRSEAAMQERSTGARSATAPRSAIGIDRRALARSPRYAPRLMPTSLDALVSRTENFPLRGGAWTAAGCSARFIRQGREPPVARNTPYMTYDLAAFTSNAGASRESSGGEAAIV